MEEIGCVYYERGLRYFELNEYQKAVEDWIHAYELGYKKEDILNIIYNSFICPNDQEFQKNFKENNDNFTELSYDNCILDFIPVSEEDYYIFDKKNRNFEGHFECKDTFLKSEKREFDNVLYTDTWDIRSIILDDEDNHYGLIYLLLGELEEKFISFFKLPDFKKRYMKKIVLFCNLDKMKKFLYTNEIFYIPQKLITDNVDKYKKVIEKIYKEKTTLKSKNSEKNLLFLKGKSQYNTSRRMIDDMSVSCQKMGYNTLVLDLLQSQVGQQLEEAIANYSFDAVITFNAMLIENEWIRKLGKKYCTIMGDHPIWHKDRLKFGDENTIVWYGDWNDVKYVKKIYPNIGRVEFCLCSATFLHGKENYSERKADIVFAGGYSDPEEIYKQICCMYSGNVCEFVKQFVNYMIDYPNKTYEAALSDILNVYGMENVQLEQFNDIAEEFKIANRYVRSYYRDKVIRILVENRIKIHVCGNGWENFKSEYSNNLIIENNHWYTARKLIANAKISLNIMPWFKGGLHDRSIISLLSGAVLLTDSSEYIEQVFKDKENIVIYRLEKLNELPQIILEILQDEQKASEIAKKGYEFAAENYTNDICTKKMIQILQEEIKDKIKLNGRGQTLLLDNEKVQKELIIQKELTELKEVDEILNMFQQNEWMEKKDYEYCIEQLKNIACKLVSFFPNMEMGHYVWDIITDFDRTISPEMLELAEMQLSYLMKAIVCKEN